MTRSFICCAAAATMQIGVVALAILTPADRTHKPSMAALILAGGLFAPAGLLIAGARD